MKKLATSFAIILGLCFSTFPSFASEKVTTNASNENPWEIFKEVIHTYKTSNVEFMYLSKAEQQAFLDATAEMKGKLSEYLDFRAEERIKRIESLVTIFTFIWDIKNDIQLTEEELSEITLP